MIKTAIYWYNKLFRAFKYKKLAIVKLRVFGQKKQIYFKNFVEYDFFFSCHQFMIVKKIMECIEMKKTQFRRKIHKTMNFSNAMICLLCYHLTIIRKVIKYKHFIEVTKL